MDEMLYLHSLDIVEGKLDNFQEWFTGIRDEYVSLLPSGVTFVGAYLNAIGRSTTDGKVTLVHRLRNFAALDQIREQRRTNARFRDIAQQFDTFTTQQLPVSRILIPVGVNGPS